MTRTPAILLAAALAAGAALLGPPTPAEAQSGSTAYDRGNAPAGIDITSLSVDNGDRRFSMRLDVRGLARRGTFVFQYWGGVTQAPPPRSLIILVTHAGHAARARFLDCGREDCVRDTCTGLLARWDRAAGRVSVSAPQTCYPHRRSDAEPPDTGRFFAWSHAGAAVDAGASEPLLLPRG